MPKRRVWKHRYRRRTVKKATYPPPELKFKDTSIANVPASATGLFMTSLTIIPQGDDEDEREGRKISVTSLTTHIHAFLAAGTTEAEHDHLIMCMVLDTQVNGSTPSALDYVVLNTNDLTFRNLSNSQRFKTLWRRDFDLNYTAAGGNGTAIETVGTNQNITVHYKFKKPLTISYSGVTGATSFTESNGLFLYVQSRHGLASANSQTRVRFYG